jgi:hypothetical protein
MKVNLTKMFASRKAKVVGAALLILVLAVGAFYWFYLRDTSGGPSKEFQAESEAIFENMKQSEIKGGMDPSRRVEIYSSINNKDFAGAKKQIDALLSDSSLSDEDKRSLYSSLAQVCLSLSDFTCIDTVVDKYGSLLDVDYFYLVEVARLAKQQKKTDLAKKYYLKAYTEIENNGGKPFVDSVNQQGLEQELNYDEIKLGAGV